MWPFKSATAKYAASVDSEFLYGVVARELSENVISPGLYAKALSESEGNECRARARYIKLRVAALRVERSAQDEAGARLAARMPREPSVKSVNSSIEAPKRRSTKAERWRLCKFLLWVTVPCFALAWFVPWGGNGAISFAAKVFTLLLRGVSLLLLFATAAALGDYVFEDREGP